MSAFVDIWELIIENVKHVKSRDRGVQKAVGRIKKSSFIELNCKYN